MTKTFKGKSVCIASVYFYNNVEPCKRNDIEENLIRQL